MFQPSLNLYILIGIGRGQYIANRMTYKLLSNNFRNEFCHKSHIMVPCVTVRTLVQGMNSAINLISWRVLIYRNGWTFSAASSRILGLFGCLGRPSEFPILFTIFQHLLLFIEWGMTYTQIYKHAFHSDLIKETLNKLKLLKFASYIPTISQYCLITR